MNPRKGKNPWSVWLTKTEERLIQDCLEEDEVDEVLNILDSVIKRGEEWLGRKYFQEEVILKQDLTIDWLDENCEGKNIIQKKCRKRNKFPKPMCETYYLDYQCGEYFVEVLR